MGQSESRTAWRWWLLGVRRQDGLRDYHGHTEFAPDTEGIVPEVISQACAQIRVIVVE
jgi:hypothetical protein